MNRAHLIEQLAIVSGYMDGGAALVARQRQRVGYLREGSQDTTLAEVVLTQLQESQMRRIRDFERMEDTLACLPPEPAGGESDRKAPGESTGLRRSCIKPGGGRNGM
jgi:hypothetical protein